MGRQLTCSGSPMGRSYKLERIQHLANIANRIFVFGRFKQKSEIYTLECEHRKREVPPLRSRNYKLYI